MLEQLPAGDVFFSGERKIGPVERHGLVIIEFFPGRENQKAQCGERFGDRKNGDQRVFIPCGMRFAVFFAGPNIDNLFAAMKNADRAADFLFFCEIFAERVNQRGKFYIPLAVYLCHAGIFCRGKAASRRNWRSITEEPVRKLAEAIFSRSTNR